ncbi:glycosyl hydrolase family 18 protein [Amycolatopsis sp. FDAARGOS 1241]|uniref:glycosyl hydrolase family 18 protein n=1 Tax=Amycolatopsis sp. FDAARGOS 1241 TaxID=2778070 RepID=UPI00194F5CB3|nr:glycosyl hydrolase family 18 protein [Amycolatopsis sp. FDAARGOS 1241]QRP44813.1 peptidoglycan hydrolase [Amycolatopsis sp. FDAARGOS 1241]
MPTRPARPRHRGRVALLLVCELLVLTLLRDGGARAAVRPHTIASLPYWNLADGTATVQSHTSQVTEASPWLYGLDAEGRLVPQSERTGDLAQLRATGVELTPTIANVTEGRWHPQIVQRILHDPPELTQHVADIVALAVGEDFAGIDIDYEELRAGDRAAFTEFITRLADSLHRNEKRLSVDVFAKTTDVGYDERNRAQDYAALGRVADQVRLMAYDYHWQTSAPGPIAPEGWVRDVLTYTVTQIPPGKIVLGVPMYGYDWVGHSGVPVTWVQAYGRSREFGAAVEWDGFSESPHFTYTDSAGQRHDVWFENAYSASIKFAQARQFRIGGVFLWLFGTEDDLVWSKLDTYWTPAEAR